jgi:hypothetical protein
VMLYFSRAYNSTNGATGTMHITGVQMELGPAATPFETRPQQMELALCQRYYTRLTEPKIVGVVDAAQKPNRFGFNWPVPLRKNPAVTQSGAIYLWDGSTSGFYNSGNIINDYSSATTYEINISASGWAIGRAIVSYANGGWWIAADAEIPNPV